MNEVKRVYCLYRVSTVGQVEKDDIPMQRQFCREFVAQHTGWEITKELYEKGISGFKTSAKDRDAIQEIQRDAVKGEFDILLVYMFDRLGRKDDETPFVVEWFVRNGIEVWSAIEGQQRFDNHVDKLLNYIRYWQASGESIKTSVRVKTRMEQLTEDGLFTGGSTPFGYRLEHRGRMNKRNRPVYDMVINEDEAEIVKLIFQKYVYEGYGAQRLSRYLVLEGIRRPSDGKNIPNTSIIHILKNPVYTGVVHNGEAVSEPIPELRIIEPEVFEKAQELMKARTTHHGEKPLNTKGKSLLVGNVYCGHCKNRLTLTTSGRKHYTENGQHYWEPRYRYQCHYNVRHPGECDGQSGYGMKKLDEIVDKVIRYQLSKIKTSSGEELISTQHEKAIELAKAKCRMDNVQLSQKQKDLADFEAETIRVIRGESRLNSDLLNSLVEKTKGEIKSLSLAAQTHQQELDVLLDSAEQEQRELAQLKSWADLYDNCSFEAKKMIVAEFVKAVYVYRGYSIEIEFNVSFDDFQKLGVTCETPLNKEALVFIKEPEHEKAGSHKRLPDHGGR